MNLSEKTLSEEIIYKGDYIYGKRTKHPTYKVIYEIPAGKLSLNEAPENCAYRELEEETGYRASSLFHLGTVAIVPGYCDELLYLYKATNLSLAEKHEDFDEFTEVEIFTLEEVKNMIKNGEIIDAKTITALAYTLI